MNKVQKVAAIYLIVLFALIYGYAVGRFKVFPHDLLEPLVKDFQAFAEGDPLEKDTSVVAKLKNDFGLSFERMLYDYPEIAARGGSLRPFRSLEKRPEPPLVFVDPAHRQGYRVIIGALNLENAFWGGLLLNPEGDIIHSWDLSTDHLPTNKAKGQLKNLYGVHVFPDGSVIFSMQESGGGIVKVDACSNVVWNLKGRYHHAVSPDEHGYFWSFVGSSLEFDQDLVKVSIETGKIVQRVDMTAVREANPDLYIWNLQNPVVRNKKAMKKKGNMTHGNDIEPLPLALAADFPQFSPGDLVISYATTNLIFVLDPQSLRVKWWRVGITDYQHDPDWEPGGMISIYSNNIHTAKFSDMVTVDPKNYEHRVTHRGESVSARGGINGRHQLTDFDTRIITSAQQGWAYEIDSEENIVFSFVNSVNKEERRGMHLAEAWRFPEDYFTSPFWQTCESPGQTKDG